MVFQKGNTYGFKKGNIYIFKKGNKLGNKFKKGHKIGNRFQKGKHPVNEFQKGKNNPNYKGGITPINFQIRNSLKYKEWRTKVFKKNNFTCQKCKDNKGGNLRAHHIQNFSDNPELRFQVDNGITFCKECHNTFHKLYGVKHNNQDQVDEYLNEVM